jgi:hypothetical protein
MLTTIDQFTRGVIAMIYKVALLHTKVSLLRQANETLSKRRRAKK